MEKYKINKNKALPSDEAINKHKNFSGLLKEHHKIHSYKDASKPLFKNFKFLSFVVLTLVVILVIVVDHEEQNSETTNVETKDSISIQTSQYLAAKSIDTVSNLVSKETTNQTKPKQSGVKPTTNNTSNEEVLNNDALQIEALEIQKTFTNPEILPEYPGGKVKMMQYIDRNLRYPLRAETLLTEGTVWVKCIIDKEGNITNPSIEKSVGNGCDEEALRLVKSLPKFKPGYDRGVPVNTEYKIPVQFLIKDFGNP